MVELSYIDLQRREDSVEGHALRRYWKGQYFRELPDDAIEALLGHHPSVAASLQAYGGAIADVPDDATAFSQRNTAFEYVGAARWTDPAEDDAQIATARESAAALEPFASGAYVNVLGDDGAAGVRRAYSPEKLTRLTALKDAVDPDNVFHLNQNIPPSSRLRGRVRRLVHDVDGAAARVPVGGAEAAGDLRGLFVHGERLGAAGMECLDAVDDEQRPNGRSGVVGVEHDLHAAVRQTIGARRSRRPRATPSVPEAVAIARVERTFRSRSGRRNSSFRADPLCVRFWRRSARSQRAVVHGPLHERHALGRQPCAMTSGSAPAARARGAMALS